MSKDTARGSGPEAAKTPARPKWFAPGVFALAFTLSFIGAELLGPIGAILGLLAGVGAGWAATRWMFTGKGPT
jgi:hypothetical protein